MVLSTFSHSELWHLGCNMIVLWSFALPIQGKAKLIDFERYKISKLREKRKHLWKNLNAFLSDILQSINVRNRPKHLKNAEFIHRCGSKCTDQKVQLNWHCVLNLNQLVEYSRKIKRINRRVKVRKQILSVYTEPAFWF